MTHEKKNLHTISFFVANKPGVLVRIALVFSRRGYNIDSLVVSPSVNPRFSRMTVTAQGDPGTLEQIIKQSSKLIDVIHVSEHTAVEAVAQELALFKIRAKSSTKAAIKKHIRHRAHIIDETNGAMIIEQSGSTEKLDELEKDLKKFGIIEMVRTGRLVMTKGKEPT